MHLGQAQVDWISFLIEADQDHFQDYYLEEWNRLIVSRLPAWAQQHQQRVHALGAGKAGRRRYILSLWGESAQQVSRLPWAKWADHLTRYDVKRRLYDIRPDTYTRLTVCLQFADTKRNIEAFKVPKRQKSDKRDSGGEGVRFGSRKSDLSTKLSRRGNEIPYFETQVQDDRLNAAVLNVLTDTEEQNADDHGWSWLLVSLEALQRQHINSWLRMAGIDKPIDGLRHDDIPMPEKLKQLFALELWSADAPLPTPLQEYGDGFDEIIDLTD